MGRINEAMTRLQLQWQETFYDSRELMAPYFCMLRQFLCCSSVSNSSENVEKFFPKIRHFLLSAREIDDSICYQLIDSTFELLLQTNDANSDILKQNFDLQFAERIVNLLTGPRPEITRAAAHCLAAFTSEGECWQFTVLEKTSLIPATHSLLQKAHCEIPIETFEYLENIFRSSSRLMANFVYNKEVIFDLLNIVLWRKEHLIECLKCLNALFANTDDCNIEDLIEESPDIVDLFLRIHRWEDF